MHWNDGPSAAGRALEMAPLGMAVMASGEAARFVSCFAPLERNSMAMTGYDNFEK